MDKFDMVKSFDHGLLRLLMGLQRVMQPFQFRCPYALQHQLGLYRPAGYREHQQRKLVRLLR